MNNFNYLLPSLGALIAVISVFITYFSLWRQLEKSKQIMMEKLAKKFENSELEGLIGEILDKKLDDMVMDLRTQIPMGAMLLTPALSGKIKELARANILKMAPDIKEKLITHLMQKMRVENILWQVFRKELYLNLLYCALLGFVLGFIWMFLEQR